jgi:polyisoprenoid-binding protein YceI/rhodanese-related sulfurtransferase
MPAQIHTSLEVETLLSQVSEVILLDVRLAEDFAESHLPGAVNQCVFEVGFLAGLAEKGFSQDQPICVYGAAEDSYESRMAADKMKAAGYQHIHDFRGGLQRWQVDGKPVEGTGTASSQPGKPMNGKMNLDLMESKVIWQGRNLLNSHQGLVPLKSGWVEFREGKAIGGEVLLDMRRLSCSDLAGSAVHEVLIHHLESDDFFDVANYPEARFFFDQVEPCSDKPGCMNLRLIGSLTLRGATKPLVIEASAGFTTEGKAALQAVVLLDRTEWGVLYGSGKFFRKLAGHLVNDHIELQLRVVTADSVLS